MFVFFLQFEVVHSHFDMVLGNKCDPPTPRAVAGLLQLRPTLLGG